MKRKIKYSVVILAVITVFLLFYHIAESNYLKSYYHKNIEKTIIAGEKYSNEKSDANRNDFIETLKDLVIMYAEIRDRENGDKAYNAKMLCDFLSSSYDILEVDQNEVSQLSDLLEGLHMLKLDSFDESGRANDYILKFVKANS